jgi:hypothetical protein
MRLRIGVALVTAIVSLTTIAPAALAECMNWPLVASERPRIAFAFTATVTSIEREEEFEEGSDLFNYRVTLDAGRVYRGDVPEEIVITGSDWQCGFFYVSQLDEGARLSIASERLHASPDGDLVGNVLVWLRDGDHWRFCAEALRDGSDPAYYSPAARRATTTQEIVRLVSRAPLPDTATAGSAESGGDSRPPSLAIVFVVALFAGWCGIRLARARR